MIRTPFAFPVKGTSLKPISGAAGLSFRDDADVSQEQLADLWLRLCGVRWTGDRIALVGYIAYLTLLLRLSGSFLEGRVSGSIFSTIVFDWTRRCARLGAVNGFRVGQDFDRLVDLGDRFPEMEAEKGTEGMLDDEGLHALGQQIHSALENLWTETKRTLMQAGGNPGP